MGLYTQQVTIAQSASVSDVAQFQRRPLGRAVSLFAPVITSCQVLAQGNVDPTSLANFRRIGNPAGSGDWTWSAGPGSKAIQADALGAFAFLRLETTVTQPNTVVFLIGIKE